jgi:hypothetical protein
LKKNEKATKFTITVISNNFISIGISLETETNYLKKNEKSCRIYNENENFLEMCKANVWPSLEDKIGCIIAPLKNLIWFVKDKQQASSNGFA